MKPGREAEPKTYLVVGCKPWNRRVFDDELSGFTGKWHYIGSPEEFSVERIRELSPRYIFFLHWSWKVPKEVVDTYECVCFHMTDLPYGRGGSPLQNLILRGHAETKLTALRMVEDLDAGPVYMKEPLSLKGSAEAIYEAATRLSVEMIKRFVGAEPVAMPQEGEVVTFKRRKPEESRIAGLSTIRELHDFIRMLDAEGYPRAFVEHDNFRFEFSRSSLCEGHLVAQVKIAEVSTGREDSE